METNPNAYFYRHVAPDQTKRTGPWNNDEKELFLEAIKVHPPNTGKWGLFATHIPGRVGYQCRNFYHRLLQSGELKAEPGELEAIKRGRGPKKPRKLTSVVEVEMVEEEPQIVFTDGNENSADEVERPIVEELRPIEVEDKSRDIESLVLFSTQLQREEQQQPLVGEESRPIEEENRDIESLALFSTQLQREEEEEQQQQQHVEEEEENPDIESLALFSTQLQREEEEGEQQSVVEESQPVEDEEENRGIESLALFSTQLQHEEEERHKQPIGIEEENPDIESLALFSTQLQRDEEEGQQFVVEESQPIEVEEENPDIESLALFSTQLQHEVEEEVAQQPIEVEYKSPDIESIALFSSQLQHDEEMEQRIEVKMPIRRKKPWEGRSIEGIVKFPAATFEYEASAILKANRDDPLNVLLLFPPGGESPTTEYSNAIRSHLVYDTQAQKDGLIAAYFRVNQAPEEQRRILAQSFVEAVVQTAH
jgi:hypothetical protein